MRKEIFEGFRAIINNYDRNYNTKRVLYARADDDNSIIDRDQDYDHDGYIELSIINNENLEISKFNQMWTHQDENPDMDMDLVKYEEFKIVFPFSLSADQQDEIKDQEEDFDITVKTNSWFVMGGQFTMDVQISFSSDADNRSEGTFTLRVSNLLEFQFKDIKRKEIIELFTI